MNELHSCGKLVTAQSTQYQGILHVTDNCYSCVHLRSSAVFQEKVSVYRLLQET